MIVEFFDINDNVINSSVEIIPMYSTLATQGYFNSPGQTEYIGGNSIQTLTLSGYTTYDSREVTFYTTEMAYKIRLKFKAKAPTSFGTNYCQEFQYSTVQTNSYPGTGMLGLGWIAQVEFSLTKWQ